MAKLLHENKKMTIFKALGVLEALESKYSFIAGESVSTSNVIIFLPKNDGIDIDEVYKGSVFSLVSRILGYLLVTFNQKMFSCQNNIVFHA